MNNREIINLHNQIEFFQYQIIFAKRVWTREGAESYELIGRAWSRPQHVRYVGVRGWEVKDCFDKSVPIMQYRFAEVLEVIIKRPILVFIINP